MAAGDGEEGVTSKAKGALTSIAGQLFHPRNYLRNFACTGILVGATAIFAPATLAAAVAGSPAIVPGAAVTTNAANLTMTSLNYSFQSAGIALKGAGSMVVNSDPSTIGKGFEMIWNGLG